MATFVGIAEIATTQKAFAYDATGQVWNGSTFAAYASGNYATYKITATEGVPGRYYATLPAGTVRWELATDGLVAAHAANVNWEDTTALPNAAADAAGGLPISDAGGLDLDTLEAAAVRPVPDPLTIGLWKFAGAATDATGRITATLANGATYATDADGEQCLSLDGTNDYATITGLLDTWPTEGWISFRFRPASTLAGAGIIRLFSKFNTSDEGGAKSGMELHVDNGSEHTAGQLVWRRWRANTLSDMTSLAASWTAGTEYHVVLYWGPGGRWWWINGVVQGWDIDGNVPSANGSFKPFTIGCYNGNTFLTQFFPGQIKDWIVAKGQMTGERIESLYEKLAHVPRSTQSGRLAALTRETAFGPDAAKAWKNALVLEPFPVELPGDPGHLVAVHTGLGLPNSAIGLQQSTDYGETWTSMNSGNPIYGQGNGGIVGNANGASLLIGSNGTRLICFFQGGYVYNSTLYRGYSDDNGATWSNAVVVATSPIQSGLYGVANPAAVRDPDDPTLIHFHVAAVQDNAETGEAFLYSWVAAYGYSTDEGVTITWDSRNPATTFAIPPSDGFPAGTYAVRSFARVRNKWHLWGHASIRTPANIPSALIHWTSDDLFQAGVGCPPPIFEIRDESFSGGVADQVADAVVLEMSNGKTLMMYDVNRNSGGSGVQARVDQVIFDGTIEELVAEDPRTLTLAERAYRATEYGVEGTRDRARIDVLVSSRATASSAASAIDVDGNSFSVTDA